VQEAVRAPFLLENITYYVDLATPLTEGRFIAEVMAHCERGLLLNLANSDINARNLDFDPLEFWTPSRLSGWCRCTWPAAEMGRTRVVDRQQRRGGVANTGEG
jgi:hypothetical protein